MPYVQVEEVSIRSPVSVPIGVRGGVLAVPAAPVVAARRMREAGLLRAAVAAEFVARARDVLGTSYFFRRSRWDR